MATADTRILFFIEGLQKVSFPFYSLLLGKRPRAKQNLRDRRSSAVPTLQETLAFHTHSRVFRERISLPCYRVFAGRQPQAIPHSNTAHRNYNSNNSADSVHFLASQLLLSYSLRKQQRFLETDWQNEMVSVNWKWQDTPLCHSCLTYTDWAQWVTLIWEECFAAHEYVYPRYFTIRALYN